MWYSSRARADRSRLISEAKLMRLGHDGRATHRKKSGEAEVGKLYELEDAPMLYPYRQTRSLGLHSWNSDPAAIVINKLEGAQVASAMATLPEESLIVATPHFLEEFCSQEIADIVASPVGTIGSRLHRGRRMLQEAQWSMAEDQGVIAGLRPHKE